MDPICDTEQKGNTYSTKIWKEYHEQKEYVEPHPIVTTRNVASLQHRWGIIQGEVNKYVGYYSQVTKRPQSGTGVMLGTLHGKQKKYAHTRSLHGNA